MFTNYNQRFEQIATESALRRVAITDFTKRRAILFCCAVVITGCATFMFFIKPRSQYSLMMESLSAFLSWMVVVRISSDLRVLKLLERLHGRVEKSAS
jgi:hypothetical protein